MICSFGIFTVAENEKGWIYHCRQIQFPKAEYFLLRSLNHPKLRCYLFALLIFKSYLVQLNSITEEHIR